MQVSQTGAMLREFLKREGQFLLPSNSRRRSRFDEVINRRYERASTVLTSNKGFEEWGQILGDEVMAAALIDRLLHHCHIVNGLASAAAATGCASTPTSPRSSTRLLQSRPLHPRREREQEQRRKRRTRGSSPPPSVQFSMARPVQLSMAVDSA